MEIKEIGYERRFNLTEFEHEIFNIRAALEEGETPEAVIDALQKLCIKEGILNKRKIAAWNKNQAAAQNGQLQKGKTATVINPEVKS